ncbi:hypothetical protein FRC10_010355, partial [Ceratobasidium sp. 414]
SKRTIRLLAIRTPMIGTLSLCLLPAVQRVIRTWPLARRALVAKALSLHPLLAPLSLSSPSSPSSPSIPSSLPRPPHAHLPTLRLVPASSRRLLSLPPARSRRRPQVGRPPARPLPRRPRPRARLLLCTLFR